MSCNRNEERRHEQRHYYLLMLHESPLQFGDKKGTGEYRIESVVIRMSGKESLEWKFLSTRPAVVRDVYRGVLSFGPLLEQIRLQDPVTFDDVHAWA